MRTTYDQSIEYDRSIPYDGIAGRKPDRMQVIQRTYATSAVIPGIALTVRDSADIASVSSFEAGDITISKDGGTPTPLTNSPTTGSDGLVKITLTSTELTCTRAVIKFIDQTSPKEWEDELVIIDTKEAVDVEISGTVDAHVISIGNVTTSGFTTLDAFKTQPTTLRTIRKT